MNTQNWEEEFDKNFPEINGVNLVGTDKMQNYIKSFISSLLSRERATAYEQGRKDGAELAMAVKDGCCDQKINIAKAELVGEMMEAVKKVAPICPACMKKGVNIYGECKCSYEISPLVSKKDTLSTLRTLAEKHNINLK